MNSFECQEGAKTISDAFEQGRIGEAFGHAERLSAANRNDRSPWVILLDKCIAQNRFRAAFRAFEKLLEHHPDREHAMGRQLLKPSGYLAAGLTRRRDTACGILVLAALAATAEIGGRAGLETAGWFMAAAISILVSAEFLARVVAWAERGIPGEAVLAPRVQLRGGMSRYIQNRPLHTFNAVRGFDYQPDATIVRVTTHESGVVEVATVTTDSLGNLCPSDTAFSPGALRILVVGDSFTSLPGNNDEYFGERNPDWPYICKLLLEGVLGHGRVNVMNFGRPSAGILQMIDIAANRCVELKPDIVICAFITRDLLRPRRYFSVHRIGGRTRELMHTECSPRPDFLHASDTAMVDERITEQWALSQIAQPTKDALLTDLSARHVDLARRMSGRTFPVLARDRSLLLDWLLAGTIFTRFSREAFGKYPLLEFVDFRTDPGFVSGLNAIRESGAKLLSVHLPTVEELIKGELLFPSPSARALLDSFVDATNQPLHLIGGFISETTQDIEKKYRRTAQDAHPSLWMKEIFARHIADLVLAEPVAQRHLGSKSRAHVE